MPNSFGVRLSKTFEKHGQLCVGIDPHGSLLVDWGLSDSIHGLRSFAFTVLEASVDRVGIIKPQVSFFERFGSKGFAVLEDLAVAAKKTDIQVIMDGKRGDIGSTMEGYFEAWLSKTAPFICDALTISPYLGFESLDNTLAAAHENQKGIFVLAATSNPEAKKSQTALIGGRTVAADILSSIETVNRVTSSAGSELGDFGAVVGATINLNQMGLTSLYQDEALLTPLLVPGFGAQGAQLKECRSLFGAATNRVVASVSRSVLSSGPQNLTKAIDSAKQDLLIGLQYA